jgi:PucR family transcriptional regulator, purine catabolism regulatory protein
LKTAEQIVIKDLLAFQSDDGEIFLKDKRMIISSADAWGLLRKDLIAALGMERAKRFLVRHGWNSGVNDARNLKEMFEWSNDLEWLLAGPQMHTISGSVFSEVTKLDVNVKAGTFYFEGIWHNSYEAQQHLLHFPHHNQSVCYNLIGYAGGYSSEYLGKKVIFKEVECIGKGDKQCRYIGKTVEEWGDEITDELVNYEEESMANELDCAYRRIEKQKETLKLGSKIHHKLTNIVLEGKGLDTLAKTLGESLVCSVAIENPNFDLLASYAKASEHPLFSLRALLKSSNLQTEQREMINKLVEDRQTIEFTLSTGFGNEHRLIAPVILRNQIFGFVSLIKDEAGFGETEVVALERAATVCAVHLYIEQSTIETEQRMKGKLLDELLNKDVDPAYITKRLNYLGYNNTDPHHVFLFQLESTKDLLSKEDEDSRNGLRNKIINIVTTQLQQAGYHCLISEKIDQVYSLVPLKFIKQKRLPLKQFGEYLLGQITDNNSSIKVTLAISNVFSDITSFYKGYQETIKTLDVAKIKQKDRQVVLSSELGHVGLLLNARNPEELETFAYSQLGQLYEYDKKNNAELTKTLYFYVENDHNLHKTARLMNISISGMRYRLRRILELLDMDCMDSSRRFELQMALDIFLVLGKLELD